MPRLKRSFFDRFLLGYSFDLDREAFSLVAINYILIVLFGIIVTFFIRLRRIFYRLPIAIMPLLS